ncbi:hypothetical protein [Acuticoccus sp. I52.16.1]|uniref:hypothetical protein n=1 Tax=Acuticoccus sp. I52.16.1 TaxID=2928472 RepID=UPI001FD40EC4|nr:hypothetical protein [Acuticoccus sp. I52.16.1]UOM36312.1 hypothetical protein MRB58_09025 [Acuticoccus sp. I52.16.1]
MRQTTLACATALSILASTWLATGSTAGAVEVEKGLTASLITEQVIADARQFLANPLVAMSVKMQNEKRRGFTQQEIEALDEVWRAERKTARKPLIAATMSSPLSTYLTRVQARSIGLYSEIFVMDAYGLNVGQSSITSDYWQGDEGKWQKTFLIGPEAIFVDEAEWHEDTRTWRAQLNMTVNDPDTGKPIGAVTIELNLTELQRRAFKR